MIDYQFIGDIGHRSDFQQKVDAYKERLKHSSVESIEPHDSKMVAVMAAGELQREAGSDRRLQQEYIEKGCRTLAVNDITDDMVQRTL
jgi:hypothetical protein